MSIDALRAIAQAEHDSRFDERNQKILARNIAAYNLIAGPRVGDFLELPVLSKHQTATHTRFTYNWDYKLQTGGNEHSYGYHLGNGHCGYSGGLDTGILTADVVATDRVKLGSCWFFEDDYSGPGRGINVTAEFRVFAVRDGADMSGIDEVQCPFYVDEIDDEWAKQRGYGKKRWFVRTFGGFGSEAQFETRERLEPWLAANDLAFAVPNDMRSSFRLKWTA